MTTPPSQNQLLWDAAQARGGASYDRRLCFEYFVGSAFSARFVMEMPNVPVQARAASCASLATGG
jgi:hypothetical protein